MSSKLLNTLVNRNPRNLELMRIARKPVGYQFEADRAERSFYYKAELQLSGAHTTGLIRHYKDGVVLTASTSESAIVRRLYSKTDVSAAQNVGRVLARRCLQAGIESCMSGVDENAFAPSEKAAAFYGELSKSVRLTEDDFIEPTFEQDRRRHWLEKKHYPTIHTTIGTA